MQPRRGAKVDAVDTLGFGSVVGLVTAAASNDPTHGTITGTIAGAIYIAVRSLLPLLVSRIKERQASRRIKCGDCPSKAAKKDNDK